MDSEPCEPLGGFTQLKGYSESIMEQPDIICLLEYWIHLVETLEDTVCFNFWYDDFIRNHDIRFKF